MPQFRQFDNHGNPVQPQSVNPPVSETTFVTDRWLADQLQMAVATIRSQRFKRRHGQKHWLTIDAVYVGSKPRYRRSEAIEWLRNQCSRGTTRTVKG